MRSVGIVLVTLVTVMVPISDIVVLLTVFKQMKVDVDEILDLFHLMFVHTEQQRQQKNRKTEMTLLDVRCSL